MQKVPEAFKRKRTGNSVGRKRNTQQNNSTDILSDAGKIGEDILCIGKKKFIACMTEVINCTSQPNSTWTGTKEKYP